MRGRAPCSARAAGCERVVHAAGAGPQVPNKERKTRKRGMGINKYRAPGARKISQDGKGGRSAN